LNFLKKNWKSFLNEAKIIYEIDLLLTISADAHKNEVLTHIRAIKGVVIVNVVSAGLAKTETIETSKLKIKFEPYTLPPVIYVAKFLTPKIRKIKGVRSFRYTSHPIGVELKKSN